MHNESPFSFGSVTSELSFHWSVSNMDILVLSSVYEEAGVSLDEEQDFDAMLRARNPGQSVVRITAKCGTGMCDPELATFTNQVQVRVLPPLELLRPIGGHFLLPQNGKAKIVTNCDGISRLSYQLMQSVGIGSGSSVIRVSSEGEIGTAAVNGHAVVMVTADAMGMGLNQSAVVHVELPECQFLSFSPPSQSDCLQHPDTGEVHDLPTLITKHQVVEINDPVQVTPKHLVILWDPQTEFKYQHQWNVQRHYPELYEYLEYKVHVTEWSCVRWRGLLTTRTKGKSLVVAVDTKNTAHFDKQSHGADTAL
ncbi:nuclear pore membrane glycoprotein 210-like isoform X1 [Halichondria panicea]|uniref:nuclear pore membrane glycoprotein 210-like isoform X1 n=1 Tax=Halichondria panicea TaxID=6063 RepID=UPI00312BAD6F